MTIDEIMTTAEELYSCAEEFVPGYLQRQGLNIWIPAGIRIRPAGYEGVLSIECQYIPRGTSSIFDLETAMFQIPAHILRNRKAWSSFPAHWCPKLARTLAEAKGETP